MADPQFTQKEMLIRIDGKLDAALARIAAVEVAQAVLSAKQEAHVLQPYHDEDSVNEMRGKVESLRGSIRFAAGAVAVLVIAAPFVFRLLVG